MTEREWPEGTDLQKMLDFLRGKASDRKLPLFACACYRLIGHLLTDEANRQAVETAERNAEELASGEDLWEAECAAQAVCNIPPCPLDCA